jgi:D-alanyl-lipoteichoic acid acyltransferase DltB (MBOAT superfamily)
LRDYLYIPLGGNRRGRATTLRNLMLTMLLGGLWHGASFSFVVWGGLHGLALAVHRRWGQAPARGWIGRGLGWALTMAFVLFAWVFFRAETVTDGFALMGGIFRGQGGVAAPWSLAVGMIVWTAVLDLPQARRRDETALLTWPWPLRGVFYAACVLLMVVLERAEDAPFIYFRF